MKDLESISTITEWRSNLIKKPLEVYSEISKYVLGDIYFFYKL